MSETIGVSLFDADDSETLGQIGGAIKDALAEEGKGKWLGTSATWLGDKAGAAIDEAIGGIDLLDMFGKAWASARDLQSYADPAKNPPDKVNYVKLGKHTVNFDVKPKLVVSLGGWSSRPVEFVFVLSAIINSMELKIRDGHIESIHGGTCDVGMTMKFAGKEVMKRKPLKTFKLDMAHAFAAPGLRLSTRELHRELPENG